jgi:hypothetical protein
LRRREGGKGEVSNRGHVLKIASRTARGTYECVEWNGLV